MTENLKFFKGINRVLAFDGNDTIKVVVTRDSTNRITSCNATYNREHSYWEDYFIGRKTPVEQIVRFLVVDERLTYIGHHMNHTRFHDALHKPYTLGEETGHPVMSDGINIGYEG